MTAKFGNGKWPQAQLYAIVAAYWRKDKHPEWVAQKLGISEPQARVIYSHIEWSEEIRNAKC